MKSSATADRSIWDDPRWRLFVRGLVIGSVIGALIAGSSVWRRKKGG